MTIVEDRTVKVFNILKKNHDRFMPIEEITAHFECNRQIINTALRLLVRLNIVIKISRRHDRTYSPCYHYKYNTERREYTQIN